MRRAIASVLLASLALAGISGCASRREAPAGGAAWVELAPGLRIDRGARVLEFDGVVAIDCHHPRTPTVYLELVACSPDTREHESLVVTDVAPSLIHAGLLALGFEAGSPGRVEFDGPGGPRRFAPSGDRLRVEFVVGTAGEARTEEARAWIIDADRAGARLGGAWVFAGSRVVERGGAGVYDADGAGTVIGLASFGSETVAYEEMISPESSVDEPYWIADPDCVPARGTAVRVRLRSW
jgi:hypothetical protein